MAVVGRPRSEAARRSILDAALRLVGERGPREVTVADIAGAAGSSTATIYRWWDSKTAVLTDALMSRADLDLPFPDTGDVAADVETQMRAVVRFFRSPHGRALRSLVGVGQADPEVLREVRERFLAGRREAARDCLLRGVRRGELRADVDVDVAIDLLYGPLWFRMLVDPDRLDLDGVAPLCAAALDGLRARTVTTA